ncbi:cache domain-containing protein [Ruminococcus albus]|uniref:Circadian input-output histidine kinase CikA n=1 Tax=Ruminococcus albus TaxID=1264 RepID=A0A1I1PXR3_RUMAL|nr:cache domain-containing protein [Ruminococcus albus]SFD14507.1 Signal transduction histidine kinase [Ruminococcus albus]
MKKNSATLAFLVAVVLLVIAMISEITLVFSVNSQQANETGSSRLEIVSRELEQTINDARSKAMRLAVTVQNDIDDRDKLEKLVTDYKSEIYQETDGVCYNVYMAGNDWYIIPDFDAPADYDVNDRSWYKGALRSGGESYVTDPYIDAATGDICYTVSVMLTDGETVVAMDYTMEDIRRHISKIYSEGEREAVIVTEKGIIAGCTDESYVGCEIMEEMPEYGGIFSLAKGSDGSVHVRQKGENLFAVRSGFGWYLIVSEDNWSLYRNSYIQMLVMIGISLIVFIMLAVMYVNTARSAQRSRKMLEHNEVFLKSLTVGLQEPLHKIMSASSPENVKKTAGYGKEFEIIRQSVQKLNDMIGKIVSYNSIVKKENTKKRKRDSNKGLMIDVHFRRLIIIALMLVFVMSLYVNTTSTLRWGRSQMREELDGYSQKLSSWVSAEKSVLDMFCSMISAEPELLDDYDGAVKRLDDITSQYSDISVSYIVNPEWEHPVIMNNGWEPDDSWHVEDREWYRDLAESENGWCISSPYFDEQTGVYCVTFAKRVHDAHTGRYIGSFGIDFYMDKLVDLLGTSYSGDGYAFITDKAGVIISHPYGSYRLTDDNMTNVAELPYVSAEPDGKDVSIISDYDGKLRVAIASTQTESGFTVYVLRNVLSVYSSVLVYGSICVLVLLGCTITVYILMHHLIALQNRANHQLKESADAAIAADEAKSTFLAQMSHEIRTPINVVLGMNEMILRECSDNSIKEYALNIQSAGRTLLSLINSILDFSKIEDGKMEIIPAEYSTASLINDLVTSVAARAADKELKLIVNADPDLPARLIGDDMRIKQVISNLLTNAVKYTEKGSVTLTVRTEYIREDEITLYVEVGDTGIGIREEDMGALFESFRRLDEQRNRSIEGTGLGMAIVTKLLDMMDSELHVESIYGVGSTFWFSLPQKISDPTPMGDNIRRSAVNEKVSETHIYAPSAEVLVVDDNEMNIKVAVSLLKMYGIVPETASSGYMALSLIREKRYDVILLDHMMPGMDGIQTLKRVCDEGMRDSDTAIIALTANAVVGARDMYIRSGFDDYLTKPIDSELLEKIMKKYLPEDKVTMVQGNSNTEEMANNDSFTLAELQKMSSLNVYVNPVVGLSYCMDSREFYLDTLDGYVEADKVIPIRAAFIEKRWDDYRVNVHAVKSASLTIGAQMLSEKAKALEFAARDGDTEYIMRNHDAFIEDYSRCLAGVEEILKAFENN